MKYLACILGLLALPSIALSQDITHGKGDKSLNFSFNGFAIGTYKYGVGGKYWHSDDLAITGSLYRDNTKVDTKTEFSGSTTSDNIDNTSYGISFGVEKFLTKSSRVLPYIGGEIGYSKSKANNSSSYDIASTTYSLDVLFGAEYMINDVISLAAEYSFGYSHIKSKSSSGSAVTTKTTKSMGLGTSTLFLLFYF
jgi:opacity protein-like surface antigen